MKNSCLLVGRATDSILPTNGRIGDDGTEARGAGGFVLRVLAGRPRSHSHLVHAIERFVDLTSVRAHLADFYSHTGRPSIDPELLIRMLLIGYCFGIRSERRLCEEVHLNLAYRWFCRLDLTDRIPDHSSFSKNRHGRFRESDLLRHVFETTVARCMAEGLVGGHGFAVDASLTSADVQKQNSSNPEDWAAREIDPDDAPRAVREYTARHRTETLPFEEVARRLRDINDHYVSLAQSWTEAELAETINFQFVGGGDGAMTREDILLHLVNHATYHRGFVSTLLYPVKSKGAASDLSVFLRDVWPNTVINLEEEAV